MVRALVELFSPLVEVAIHDLEKGQLVAIFNNLSQRKIGEASPLKELGVDVKNFPPYFSPYYKQNWDGRPLKCTSITLRSSEGIPVGLICVNMDVSLFQEGVRFLENFLGVKESGENPIEIFGNSFEEQAELFMQEYEKENHLSIKHLDRNQKRLLVQHLYRKGIFHFKNAAPFIAKKLQLSRASIYNHIKQIGDKK